MSARRPALILSVLTAAALGAVAVRARGRLGAAAGAAAGRLRPGSARSGPAASPAAQETFSCECGQAYRVRGTGRHRLYWPEGADARAVLGGIDALKLRSSMTLFARAAPEEERFRAVLDRFFGGEPDPETERRL